MVSVYNVETAVQSSNSFKVFQDLPELVRNSLAVCLARSNAGDGIEFDNLIKLVIDCYDMNQVLPIGELTEIIERFIDRQINIRMIHCYLDHGCNMVAAKLAWREDY